MTKKLLKRSEVDPKYTWKFEDMYKTREAFDLDVNTVSNMVNSFIEDFDKQDLDLDDYKDAIARYNDIEYKLSLIDTYATLPASIDATSNEYRILQKKISQFYSEMSEKLSFFESMLYTIDDSIFEVLLNALPEYKGFIRQVRNQAKRSLSKDVEKTLKKLSPVLNSFMSIYETNKLCDLSFEDFTVNGKTYPLSFNLYEGKYAHENDTDVRRAAFKGFSKVLDKYKNTIAEVYYNQVVYEKTMATLRGYDSVFDYLLDRQESNRDLFNRQLDTIMEHLSPVMRKYVRTLKKVRGLDKLYFSDLKIDFDPTYSYKVSIEEAQDLVEKSISIMGDEYKNQIMRYNEEHWIDYPQNIGKASGGFACMANGVHPYVMMSWADNLSSVYTLIHELGHCGEALYLEKNRKFLDSFTSMYIVEAPSTFNELLFTNYLSNKAKSENDPKMERFAISKLLSDTYFHNMVTHLLEAYYQREVYALIDNGESFDADTLCNIKRSVLEKFWGDDVIIDEGAELTWMRQPHYYMGLYSYTYSAGLTVATQAFLKIREHDEEARDKWLDFLSVGSSLTPIEAAKVAGVDITTSKPLLETINYLDEMCDRLIELS